MLGLGHRRHEDHDPRLQPLGLVQVHDPHRFTPSRPERCLGARSFQGDIDQLDCAWQGQTGSGAFLAQQFHQMQQRARPRVAERKSRRIREEPGRIEQVFDQEVGRHPAGGAPPLMQRGERLAARAGRLHWWFTHHELETAGSAGVEIGGREAETESLERRCHEHGVRRISQRAEDNQQLTQFFFLRKRRTGDADRDVASRERARVWRQRLEVHGQHQEIRRVVSL